MYILPALSKMTVFKRKRKILNKIYPDLGKETGLRIFTVKLIQPLTS